MLILACSDTPLARVKESSDLAGVPMDNSSQNQNTKTALHYHENTKHSEESLKAKTHVLDWRNKPLPFKIYRSAESVPLMRDPDILDGPTPAALEIMSTPVSRGSSEDTGQKNPDLAMLSQVLFLAAAPPLQGSGPGAPASGRGCPLPPPGLANDLAG